MVYSRDLPLLHRIRRKSGNSKRKPFSNAYSLAEDYGSRRAKKDSRRDELDRVNDVVTKLFELIARYPLPAMRRRTNLVHLVLREDRRTEEKTLHVTGATSLHIPISSDLNGGID